MPWYYVLLTVAGVFLAPVVLGHYISRAVRLPDQSWRVSLVLFALIAGAVVTYAGWPPKLGIDLSGGSILVYEIKDPREKPDMEKLIAAVTMRVNPGGVKEVTIRPYGVGQIEVIIPKASPEELKQIKEKISATGLLEFRILANTRDHADIIARAQQLDDNVDQLYEGEGDSRRLVAQWFPVLPAEVSKLGGAISRKNAKGQVEDLVVMDDYNVNGGYLSSATSGIDEKGQPCVNFIFNSRGAKLFEGLTRENLPEGVQGFKRQLAIILDGTIYSAPSINDVISSRGQISGSFTPAETNFLSEVLTAGSLPTALRKDPSTELVTGPTMGADTIRKGEYAMIVSTAVVMIFMVVYYRFAGIAANLALALNVLLILAFMILFKAAFTLSGLAGLALTVGMAVDANVLIYERIREELSRGATLRMAIRNGFGRATTTIIDANVTTLIAAVVLFAIGTDQVKGFAVTLILGILMNLFTAITCTRLLFDIGEKMRWVTQLKMMHIFSNPNYDFIGKRAVAVALSVIVIAIGMVGVVARGKGLLDIDFTGGVSVEVVFQEPQKIADIREKLRSIDDKLPDVTVQDVQIASDKPNLRYVVNTSVQDSDGVDATIFVENQLKKLFPGQLAVNQMTVGEVALIEGKTSEKPAEKPAAEKGAAKEPAAQQPAANEPAAKQADKKEAAPASDAKDKPATKQGAAHGLQRSDDSLRGDARGLLAFADSGASVATVPVLALLAQDETKGPPQQPVSQSTKAPIPDSSKSDVAKPVSKTAPASVPAAAAKTPARSQPASQPKSPAAVPAKNDRFVGGTSARLNFTMGINGQDLAANIRAELKRLDPAKSDVAFDLTSPDEAFEPGSDRDFLVWNVKMALPPQKADEVLKGVSQELAAEPSFPSSNKIGAAVAGNTQRQAAVALLASMALIVIYVWFRFTQIMFGLAGIIALVHDVLVTLGALALSYWLAPYLGFALVEPFKISLPVVAAFLTIIGYSINDTIVVFDRIREVRGKSPYLTAELCNTCINQTLSRTILTSLTVFLVALILYAVGGQGVHSFAFAMVVGVVAGTYSSVYVATPLVLWMNGSDETAPKPATAGQRATQPAATR
jgi:SecD/SecF fusion protein